MIEVPIVGTNQTLICPDVLESGYIPKYVYDLKDLSLFKDHRRLSVFYIKGVTCVNPRCGISGQFLIKGVDLFNNVHVDVYTADFKLMTVDHIIPKAKKGSEHISNKQPMCRKCNIRKADKIKTYD